MLERERVVWQRVNQRFFRAAALAAYGGRCCITNLGVQDLLIASHIVPWQKIRPTASSEKRTLSERPSPTVRLIVASSR